MKTFEPFADREKLKALTGLAASVVELLEPITVSILTESDRLRRPESNRCPEASAALIRHKARCLQAIVNCLNSFSDTRPRPVCNLSIPHILQENERLFRLLLRPDAKLVITCDEDIPEIQGDQRSLEDIICALIATASNYAFPDSTVTISVIYENARRLGWMFGPARICVGLEYAGEPKPTEFWQSIFLPKLVRKNVGISIGLAIIHSAVVRLSGRLSVTYSQSTTLHLIVPAVPLRSTRSKDRYRFLGVKSLWAGIFSAFASFAKTTIVTFL